MDPQYNLAKDVAPALDGLPEIAGVQFGHSR